MTKTVTIHGHGKFEITNAIGKKPSYSYPSKMLEMLIKAFAKESTAFLNETDYWPFMFRERQLHTVFFPSLCKYGDVVFVEQKISRQVSWAKTTGWVDYWMRKDQKSFLIELKHVKAAVRGNYLDHIKWRWDDLATQLNKIKKSEIKLFRRHENDTVFKVGILVAPLYLGSWEKDKEIEVPKERVAKIYKELCSKIKADIHACWYIPNEINKIVDDEDDDSYHMHFPAVMFFVKVDIC